MAVDWNDAAEWDLTPRYTPDALFVVWGGGKFKHCPVTGSRFYPAGSHPPNVPIKAEYGCLELVTEGGSRFYGCQRAYINSELRMIVIGTNRRDEVRMQWEAVPAENL